jgi:hypothetical protein
MSVKCPSCGFDSPAEAAWCDLCKHPFLKKRPPSPPADPLAGLTKEQLLELPAEQLLRAEEKPAVPPMPPWMRPLAWGFLAVLLVVSSLALFALLARYNKNAPPSPGGESGAVRVIER